MKKEKITILLIIIILLLIGIVISLILSNNNGILKEKQVIKEMSESTQVLDLQTQINNLNKEHTEYADYIQTCKNKIATAITDMGVETSGEADADTMANNIKSLSSGEFKLLDSFLLSDNQSKILPLPENFSAVVIIGGLNKIPPKTGGAYMLIFDKYLEYRFSTAAVAFKIVKNENSYILTHTVEGYNVGVNVYVAG